MACAIIDGMQSALGGLRNQEPDMQYDQRITDLANARETSTEIIEACEALGPQVWADPKYEEVLAVWERVTGNGLRPSTDYVWGSSGRNWARDLGIEV